MSSYTGGGRVADVLTAVVGAMRRDIGRPSRAAVSRRVAGAVEDAVKMPVEEAIDDVLEGAVWDAIWHTIWAKEVAALSEAAGPSSRLFARWQQP